MLKGKFLVVVPQDKKSVKGVKTYLASKVESDGRNVTITGFHCSVETDKGGNMAVSMDDVVDGVFEKIFPSEKPRSAAIKLPRRTKFAIIPAT